MTTGFDRFGWIPPPPPLPSLPSWMARLALIDRLNSSLPAPLPPPPPIPNGLTLHLNVLTDSDQPDSSFAPPPPTHTHWTHERTHARACMHARKLAGVHAAHGTQRCRLVNGKGGGGGGGEAWGWWWWWYDRRRNIQGVLLAEPETSNLGVRSTDWADWIAWFWVERFELGLYCSTAYTVAGTFLPRDRAQMGQKCLVECCFTSTETVGLLGTGRRSALPLELYLSCWNPKYSGVRRRTQWTGWGVQVKQIGQAVFDKTS